jgi:hypothetical protein
VGAERGEHGVVASQFVRALPRRVASSSVRRHPRYDAAAALPMTVPAQHRPSGAFSAIGKAALPPVSRHAVRRRPAGDDGLLRLVVTSVLRRDTALSLVAIDHAPTGDHGTPSPPPR